ncbi:MAG TPA: baseplate J/gp47 family protein [Candidatus Acidoferrales bacterium]|nr:baseplate J/gp47 family protein [Candidatus Acidoferrales bacterium]
MPLIPPALDDRSYDDLVQEMLANIPAHTPEWSNPQAGDPGRTLIELFAWLADTILYRANLIPERQRIAFLKLIGQTLQPAAAAQGLIALSQAPSATVPRGIVAGASVTGALTFETLGEVDILPVTAQAYIKAPMPQDSTNATLSLLSGLKQLYNLPALPSGYQTTPVFTSNLADPNGIDLQAGTIDQCLWIALFAGTGIAPSDIATAIGGANGQRILSIGFVPSLPATSPLTPAGGTATAPQATWQMSGPPDPKGQPVYNALTVIADEDSTSGLTQAGVVRLIVPQAVNIGAPTNSVTTDMQAGVGPKPPRIDDPKLAARLVTWVRLNAQSALSVGWLGINAVGIDQRTTYNSVVIGVSNGNPNQQFSLGQTQIDPETFQLQVYMPGFGYALWQQVDDLAVLQGPLWAYRLDPEAGIVSFGNQLQGMIPPVGQRVLVLQMRAGGGSAGNLPAASLAGITAKDATGAPVGQLTVVQPIPTTGGADSETLDQAQQRIPAMLRHQGRAVTAGDYQTLAESMPGANLGRVAVLPLFKPQTMANNVPGVVSVMVIPNKEGVAQPCPRADRTLLQSVYHYLSPLAPATAEMYVIGSDYVGVGVSVGIEVRAGYGLMQVAQAVETALRNYLWPIAPGGLDNGGWELGRNVRSLELEVVVSKVPGVVEVDCLLLFSALANGGFQLLPTDANGRSELTLQSWQLVELQQVVVTTESDGTTAHCVQTLTPPAQPDPSVAVPVVPKVC